MSFSRVGAAARAFVAVLLLLARRYELVLEVNRDSSPERLLKAYRKVLLKAHPDKGGSKVDTQKLQAAKASWEKARRGSSRGSSTGSSRVSSRGSGRGSSRGSSRVSSRLQKWVGTRRRNCTKA
jgi:curved DNA-binding protein CbpA